MEGLMQPVSDEETNKVTKPQLIADFDSSPFRRLRSKNRYTSVGGHEPLHQKPFFYESEFETATGELCLLFCQSLLAFVNMA